MSGGTDTPVVQRNWVLRGLDRLRPRYAITVNWVFQFALVSWILFFQGLGTPHGLVTMDLSPERMARIFGFADAGSYLQAAQNLIANGRNTEEWAWVLNLWPPGMVWLDALIIKVSPLGFGLSIGLVTSLVWSIALSLLTWPLLRSRVTVVAVVMSELIVLGTSPFQSWMFDEGLFYADALAAGLFLLAMCLIVNRIRTDAPLTAWIRDGILAGAAFAGAVYLRASYNLVIWALIGIATLIVIIITFRRVKGISRTDLGRQAIIVGVAAVSVLVLMQPYTAFMQQERGRTAFVETEDLVFQHAWEDPQHDVIPQWMLDGGSTIGCDLDPVQCAKFEQESADGVGHEPSVLQASLVKAILLHPVEFVGNRVRAVSKQWFADELSSYSHVATDYRKGPVSYASSDNLNPGQGLLYLLLLIAAFCAAIVLAVRGRWAMLIVPILALAILAPFAIVHVEVRYLIPLKLIGLLAPLLLLSLREQKRHSNKPVGLDGVITTPEGTHVTEARGRRFRRPRQFSRR